MNPFKQLAKDMASIACCMKEALLQTYQKNTENQLISAQWSDEVVQTIITTLFIFKYHHVTDVRSQINTQEFSYSLVIQQLSNINSFLYSVFNELVTIDSNSAIVEMINQLITKLNQADVTHLFENFPNHHDHPDPIVHFYEIFLSHYDRSLRAKRGVYYTPEPVASYIVNSLDWVLKEKFGLIQGLADNTQSANQVHTIQILDPAVGTGVFLSAVFSKIHQYFQYNKSEWAKYISTHLIPRVRGYELLLPAYAMACINLNWQLQQYGDDGKNSQQLPIILTNTLEPTSLFFLDHHSLKQPKLANFSEQTAPIMVILGNPPYSYHSSNKGNWIGELSQHYYHVDGKPLKEKNPKALQDDYVKFIRLAQWHIERAGNGVIGFVTNHSYLDHPTFRGMRQSLLHTFDEIYILDLHGNAKKKERSPDNTVDHNIFNIQQGVVIGIFIKNQSNPKRSPLATVYHADLYGEHAIKSQYLKQQDLSTTSWKELSPQTPFYLLVPQNTELLSEYEKNWKITDVMPIKSMGITTAKDHFTIHDSKESVWHTVQDFSNLSIEDARIKYHLGQDSADWNIANAQRDIKKYQQDRSKILPITYRPFDTRFTFYTGRSCGFHSRPRMEVMQHLLSGQNLGLVIGRAGLVTGSDIWDVVFCSKWMTDLNLYRRGGSYLFPLYLNPISPSDQSYRTNFSKDFLNTVQTSLGLRFICAGQGDFIKTISALDIFHYIYAIFHSPAYRQRYAAFLKIDFPRFPLTEDRLLFKKFSELGRELVNCHLMNAQVKNHCCFPIKGDNHIEKVTYQNNKVYINNTQYIDGVTPELWEFRIGGYQIVEKWLKDRKNRRLSQKECDHYLYLLAAVEKTLELMRTIDDTL